LSSHALVGSSVDLDGQLDDIVGLDHAGHGRLDGIDTSSGTCSSWCLRVLAQPWVSADRLHVPFKRTFKGYVLKHRNLTKQKDDPVVHVSVI
jgi:hypothetical protein